MCVVGGWGRRCVCWVGVVEGVCGEWCDVCAGWGVCGGWVGGM